MTEDTKEEKKEVKKEKVKLEQLPIHALRSELKEQKIKFKSTDKKKDLIEMLRDGETKHKPREVKRAAHLSESKGEQAVPMVPKEIRADLEALAKKGLEWKIDKESGCINFMKDIPTCANLDQPAQGILRTARDSFSGMRPIERGDRPDGHPIEWS